MFPSADVDNETSSWKLLSWNVAGRTGILPRQTAAVERREPDLVALQEVRPSTVGRWRDALAAMGLGYAIDSAALAGGRRIFNLTAARWELSALPAGPLPQPERVLRCRVDSPWGPIEVWNAHVPPAPPAGLPSPNGLAKLETCEALFSALARVDGPDRILCGDLNTPRFESADGWVETFASNHPGLEDRWDAAERSVVTGLAEWGLRDAFRELNGYGRRDVSWMMNTRARRKAAHRLDHILCSPGLGVAHCDYVHEWREAGLSDHSAMEAIFRPRGDASF